MASVSDIRNKLLEEAARRDISKMDIRQLDEYARMVNSIASIPEKSYQESMMSILAATNMGFGTTGGGSSE